MRLRETTNEYGTPVVEYRADPPCHLCGGGVFLWDENASESAICAACCTHPDGFEYERGEGWRCPTCFCEAPDDYFRGWFDE